MSYIATIVGGARDGEEVEYGNQFLLIRHLLLGTVAIDRAQAIKAWDEIEALVRTAENEIGPAPEIDVEPLRLTFQEGGLTYQLPTGGSPMPLQVLHMDLDQNSARDLLQLLNQIAFTAWQQGPHARMVLQIMRRPNTLLDEKDA